MMQPSFKETLIGHVPEALAEQFRERGYSLRFIGWGMLGLPVHEVRKLQRPQPAGKVA
ncbi:MULTISPECIES: hypothetical protein [Vogesella]|nr:MULTISPECIES: hypothetical protein [Vogesella]MCQ4143186.1 hypothetical protein [Vogesella sp. AC12]